MRRPRLIALATFAALAAGLLVPATTAPPAEAAGRRPNSAEGQSEPIHNEFIVEQLSVETSHGTLRGEVRRPVVEDGVQVPIILQVSPYGILNESLAGYDHVESSSVSRYFVPRGYAFAVFDAVGTHGSSGCTDFGGLGERESTAELVDHLGELPWSNGRVGMIGASYDGTLAIAAAIEAPEHLVTIVPQVAIDRWYDYMYNQGVRMVLEDVSGRSGAIPADPPGDSPADYDTVYGVVPDAGRATTDPASFADAVAAHVQPCNRVDNQSRGYEIDPVYDEFWQVRDYRALADNVTASVLFEGAWLDDNVKHWAATRFFAALPDDLPKRLVIGQWTHSTSRFGDALHIRHAWFDHFLLGLDTGILEIPRVDSQANDGLRRQSDQWPPEGSTVVAVPLDGSEVEGWMLALDSATPTWTDANPLLTEEAVADDACGPACIRLSTSPLDADVRLAGAPVLVLDLVTDQPSTHVTPILWDVAPDGAREPISRGLLNSNNRAGLATSEPLPADGAWTATVELWDLDHVLAAGHHLELTIASTNATFGLADETRATSTAALATSRLELPIGPPPEAMVMGELDIALGPAAGKRVGTTAHPATREKLARWQARARS